MEAQLVAAFSTIGSRDLALVGGKGANLGELTRAGFPVPAGFCVTTIAFRAFIDAAGDTRQLFDRLAIVNPEDIEAVRRLGEELRTRLRHTSVPQEVADAIVQAWHDAGTDFAYAVRSSATAEDLPGASFAGQQDTFLNVRGREQLLDRVRDCWASLFTDRAIVYRARNGFDHRRVLLSVVVQRMVAPDVSGIMFTADPFDGRRHIVSIDAGFGLGEALVSGLVSADLYKIDKRRNEVVERKIASKTVAIWPLEDGGTRRDPLPAERQDAPSLTNDEALGLARLGTAIEAHFKSPQDIEWCIEAGRTFVVQSRPITTLYPLPEPRLPEIPLRVYISFGHAQVMTDALLPYARSVLRRLFPFGRDASGNSVFMVSAGGRLYIDPSDLLRVDPPGRIFPRILTVVDALMADAVADVVQRPEFGFGTGSKAVALRNVVPLLGPVFARTLWRTFFSFPERIASETLAFINARIESMRAALDAEPAGVGRYEAAVALMSNVFLRAFPPIAPTIISGLLALALVKKLVRGRATDRDLTIFTQGLDGNVTTEMDLELGDLADLARQHPEVVAHLRGRDAAGSIQSVRSVAGGEAFYGALQAFLEKYGTRGGSEIDITRRRWNDDPTPLIQVVVGNLARDEPGVHRAHHARLKRQGEEAAARIVAAAPPLTRPIVRRLVRVCRHHLAVREHPKFMLIQAFALVKRVTMECAELLVQQGRLNAGEDVFYLTVDEVRQALRSRSLDLKATVASRRSTHRQDQKLIPPRVFTSDGEIVTKKHRDRKLPENALAGSPASPGVVEGRAKVVLDPATAVLEAGEILVAPFTDPGWTPLFISARGLVMEVGGLMTHGSVVAREYGIPAVVSVPEATTKIRTGQQIRVNGDDGFVEIL